MLLTRISISIHHKCKINVTKIAPTYLEFNLQNIQKLVRQCQVEFGACLQGGAGAGSLDRFIYMHFQTIDA